MYMKQREILNFNMGKIESQHSTTLKDLSLVSLSLLALDLRENFNVFINLSCRSCCSVQSYNTSCTIQIST